jgi:DNA polymerase III epsilon subunit-like protein
MSSIILDVETTGLPTSRNAPYTDLAKYESARVVQFTMMLCDDSLNEVALKDYIIKADDFIIENSHIHGITDEVSQQDGTPFEDILPTLKEFLEQSDTIYAHNADFDINVIKSELFRIDTPETQEIIDLIDTRTIICTMKETTDMVNIKTKYGPKWPTLAELYQFLFNSPLANAHNSKYDVINLHKIVQKLYGTAADK